jgi:hypothetical protein
MLGKLVGQDRNKNKVVDASTISIATSVANAATLAGSEKIATKSNIKGDLLLEVAESRSVDRALHPTRRYIGCSMPI